MRVLSEHSLGDNREREGHARLMTSDSDSPGTPGTRAVFVTNLVAIAIGLILMIAVPLAGR